MDKSDDAAPDKSILDCTQMRLFVCIHWSHISQFNVEVLIDTDQLTGEFHVIFEFNRDFLADQCFKE